MSNSSQLIDAVLSRAHEEQDARLKALCDILSIASVSTLPECRGDLERAAEWCAAELARIGLRNVRQIATPNGGARLVYGEWLEAPGAPTCLIYGHYDVQPADAAEWASHPFKPEIRDGHIFARGANDNKGQFMALLSALRAWMSVHGTFPLNIKVVLEGEEEIGSTGICAFIADRANHDLLRADFALIADTDMAALDQGAITTRLRGLNYYDVLVEGPGDALHSGLFGGGVMNPLTVLDHLMASMMDLRTGRILVPGFYDGILEPSAAELAELASNPTDLVALLRETGAPALWERPGISYDQAVALLPTFERHGADSGFTKPGGRKTIVPPKAFGKFSFRLVPGQEPKRITALVTEFLQGLCPPSVRLTVTPLGDGVYAAGVDPNNPFVARAARALSETFGKETVYRVSGGTIGAVSALSGILRIPCVMAGFGLPGDRIHGKDENFGIDRFNLGTDATIRLLGSFVA